MTINLFRPDRPLSPAAHRPRSYSPLAGEGLSLFAAIVLAMIVGLNLGVLLSAVWVIW